jgi:hypothetical protein
LAKENSATTKARLIKIIGQNHPIFKPDHPLAQKAFKNMERLSVDALSYICALIAPIVKRK